MTPVSWTDPGATTNPTLAADVDLEIPNGAVTVAKRFGVLPEVEVSASACLDSKRCRWRYPMRLAESIPFAFGVFVDDEDSALAAVDPDVEGPAAEVPVDLGRILG